MKPNRLKEFLLTQEELKKWLNYNEKTGTFIRIKDSKKAKRGDIAGHNNKNGYIYICVNGITYLAQRLAWLYMTGKWPDKDIDHKDLDKNNNAWNNLREAGGFNNNYNKRLSKRNTTGFKGIWFNKSRKRWESQIVVRGKKINLGRFLTAEDAALAYQNAAKKHHGEFYKDLPI